MKIAIAGDFYVPFPEQIQVDNTIKKLLDSCNYSILNFEGPIDDELEHNVKKSGPRLKLPPNSIQILRELGIDALTLANNHIMDNGPEGFNYTRRSLSGFKLCGAGSWADAYRISEVELDGKKVGFINLAEMQFGLLYDEWCQKSDEVGCAWINHPKVNKLIAEGKKDVDFLIAICHAGVENINFPLPEWRERYREMIDLGCDAVIAHHPHAVQGYEFYKGSPICYSLGNFCFPTIDKENDEIWNTGAIAVLSFNNSVIDIELYGCHYNHGMIRLIDQKEWAVKLKALCELLQNDYINKVNQMCLSLLNQYWNLFAMGGLFNPRRMTIKDLGRILTGRYSNIHLLNNLQCESHRWCICRGIRLLLGL